jgi:hypothetical protein
MCGASGDDDARCDFRKTHACIVVSAQPCTCDYPQAYLRLPSGVVKLSRQK